MTEPEIGALLRWGTNGPGWGQAGGLPLPASPYRAPSNAPLRVGIHHPPPLCDRKDNFGILVVEETALGRNICTFLIIYFYN